LPKNPGVGYRIRQLLKQGYTPSEVISMGFNRNTVYYVFNQLQSGIPRVKRLQTLLSGVVAIKKHILWLERLEEKRMKKLSSYLDNIDREWLEETGV